MNSDEPDEPREGLYANWAVREVDHLFQRFSRYTRFVLYSKWFLGIFALGLMVALVLYPMLSKDKSGLRVSFIGTEMANLKNGGGASPSMNSPVYEGIDANGQQYKITGAKATQVSSELVVVDQVQGQILTGKSFVSLTADRAEYRSKQHRIDLIGNVNVLHGDGYTFVTPQATVDTDTMDVTGTQQISGEGPMGNLLATGFEIRDKGNRIRFGGTNRVQVVIDKTNGKS